MSLYTNFQDFARAIKIALQKKADKSYVDTNIDTINAYLDTKVDKVAGYGLSENDFTDARLTKLNGIEDGAEVNVQANWTQSNSSEDDFIKNKPTLATVATSGDYDDLTNKPTIPTVPTNISAFTNDVPYATETYVNNGLDDKVDKVAGKGLSTEDFTSAEKTKLATVQANAEENVQANWSQTDNTKDDFIKNKPTKVSDFTNDSNFTTKTYVDGALDDKVDKVSGKQLSTEDFTTAEKTKLSGIEDGAEANVQADWTQSDNTKDDYIKNKPTLATVATSGSYNDLSNKPTIPVVPTNVSAFTNDAGYITKAVDDLTNYYIKTDTYTKTEVNTLINNITKVTIQIVQELPADPSPNVIYFVPKSTAGTNNGYYEYIYVNNNWELIGDTEVDLSDYATITYVDTGLGGKVDKVTGYGLSKNDFTDALLTKLNGIEAGAEANVQSNWNETNSSSDAYIQNKPTNVSAFTNDANYTTKSYVDGALDDKVDKVTGKQLSTEDFTTAEKTKLSGIEAGAEENVQSDWSQADNTKDDFIKNKPTKVSDFTNDSNFTTKTYVDGALDDKVDKVTGYGLSKNDFTDALLTKLNGIEDGAEENVQSDWNQTNTSADDFIKNKPTDLGDFTNNAGYATQTWVDNNYVELPSNPNDEQVIRYNATSGEWGASDDWLDDAEMIAVLSPITDFVTMNGDYLGISSTSIVAL